MDFKINFPEDLGYFDHISNAEEFEGIPKYLFNTVPIDIITSIRTYVPVDSIDGKISNKPEQMSYIFHGSWGIGKSNLLMLIAQFASSRKFLVFYEKECGFLQKNESNQDFEYLNRDAISHWKTIIGSHADPEKRKLLRYLNFNTESNKVIISNLMNIRLAVPVCFVLDQWHLLDPKFPFYKLPGNVMGFVSGSGGWKPEMSLNRIPDRARYRKYHIEMKRLTADKTKMILTAFLKFEVSNDLADKVTDICQGVFVLVNQVYDIISNNSQYLPYNPSMAPSLMEDLRTTIRTYYKGIVSGIISSDKHEEGQITKLLNSANLESPIIDTYWLDTGICTAGSFFHPILQDEIAKCYQVEDNVTTLISKLTYKTEDAFETLFSYLFYKHSQGSLALHNGCTVAFKGKCELQWNSFFEYEYSNSNTVTFTDNSIYHLKMAGGSFPAIDFCCKNGNYIYAIQVSVEATREDHDRLKVSEVLRLQGNLPQAVKDWLTTQYNTPLAEIRYVYLSPYQFKRTQKQEPYWVPESFDYFKGLCGNIKLYTFILSSYKRNEPKQKRKKIE